MDLLARARAASDGRARAEAARSQRGSAVTAPRSAEDAVVPYDCLRDVLESHPLPYAMGVSARDVYAGIVVLYQKEHAANAAVEGAQMAKETAAPPEPQRLKMPEDALEDFTGVYAYKTHGTGHECSFCGEHVVLDEAHGESTCSSCGIVARSNLNFRPNPKHEDEQVSARKQQPQAQPQLPPWVAVKYGLVDANPTPFLKDLDHWNQFTHHGRDTLMDLDRTLTRWPDDSSTPKPARMAAAMLYPLLGANLPRIADVRKRVGSLGAVTSVVPEAGFPCGTCGHACHTGKQARLHCGVLSKWGKRKRL